jgi:hypothetical protein
MVKWCNAQKWKKVIRNEIMVYHGYVRPISFKPMYIELEWLKIKEENNYSNVMFMLLER